MLRRKGRLGWLREGLGGRSEFERICRRYTRGPPRWFVSSLYWVIKSIYRFFSTSWDLENSTE